MEDIGDITCVSTGEGFKELERIRIRVRKGEV